AGAPDDGGGDGVQGQLATVHAGGGALELAGDEDAGHAGVERAEDEAHGADGGRVHAGPAGRYPVAADGVDVAAGLGPVEQQAPQQEDAAHFEDVNGHALDGHDGQRAAV